MLELRQLRVFLEVARQGSTLKAAQALGRTQPSLSMALRDLQEALGVRLFERVGRRNQLSLEGRALLERAAPLLEEWEALPRRLLETTRGIVTGPVRVGAGEGGALYLLPEPIRALRKRLPQVQVVVRNQSSEDTLAMLKTGELDFGLRSFPRPPPGTEYQTALRFDRVVVAPRGHPIHAVRRLDAAALARHPFVMPWPRSTTRRLVERALEAEHLPCRIALEGGGWEVVMRYVGLGLGIAVVPSYCVGPKQSAGLKARSVSHLFGQDAYGIVIQRGRELPTAARELVRLIDPSFAA
jgi:DNA-binding transcriptional LysR family regulator